MSPLTVVEARSRDHTVGRAVVSLKDLRKNLPHAFLLAAGFCQQSSAFLGLQPHHASHYLRPLCVSVCVSSLFFSYKDTSPIRWAPPPTKYDLNLITSSKTPFLNKVTFPGTRGVRTSTYPFRGHSLAQDTPYPRLVLMPRFSVFP